MYKKTDLTPEKRSLNTKDKIHENIQSTEEEISKNYPNTKEKNAGKNPDAGKDSIERHPGVEKEFTERQKDTKAKLFRNVEAEKKITYGFTNDYMFRAVFQKNPLALKGILAAVLECAEEEIETCGITNPIVLGESVEGKNCILDIKVRMNNQEMINLEMQMGNMGNWTKRSVYYLCSMYTDLKKGQDYNEALPCTHIGFVSGSPFPDYHEFFSKYHLMDEVSRHTYSRDLSLIVVDLSMAGKSQAGSNEAGGSQAESSQNKNRQAGSIQAGSSRKEEDQQPKGVKTTEEGLANRAVKEKTTEEKSAMEEDVERKGAAKNRRENEKLRQWAELFQAENWEEAMELSEKSAAMREAVVTMHELSEEEKIKQQCEARMYYQGDMKGALMQGRKEGMEKGIQKGMQKGMQKGIEKGKDRVNMLNKRLLDEGRTEDLSRSIVDQVYQEKLLQEYGFDDK